MIHLSVLALDVFCGMRVRCVCVGVFVRMSGVCVLCGCVRVRTRVGADVTFIMTWIFLWKTLAITAIAVVPPVILKFAYRCVEARYRTVCIMPSCTFLTDVWCCVRAPMRITRLWQ